MHVRRGRLWEYQFARLGTSAFGGSRSLLTAKTILQADAEMEPTCVEVDRQDTSGLGRLDLGSSIHCDGRTVAMVTLADTGFDVGNKRLLFGSCDSGRMLLWLGGS